MADRKPSVTKKVLDKIPSVPHGVSGAAAGPEFRWGATSTIVTVVLSVLLILSWTPYDYVARYVFAGITELIGGTVVIGLVILKVPFLRFGLLKTMLRYRGWAYDPRSPFSRLFLVIVSILGGSKPKLWTFQEVLPPLPVPPLEQTLQTYLKSVQPLLTKEEFETTKAVVAKFEKNEGKKLQAMLEERGTKERNWLGQWWEEIVYLQGRYPLPIFSNWYGLDRIHPIVRSQLGRAANFSTAIMKFWTQLHDGTLDPNRVQDTVPLCMWQYSRIFGTVRVPQEKQDKLEFYPNSPHVAVLIKNQWFKLEMFHTDGTLQSTKELLQQFMRINEDAEDNADDVAMLTSQPRDTWAKQRKELIEMDSKNKETIEMIETALFHIILEDDDIDDHVDDFVDRMARHGMHRNGKSFWFDKNFSLVFLRNGHLLCNVDHTWADASTMVFMFDYCHKIESPIDMWVSESEHPPVDKALPAPKKYDFVLTNEAKTWIKDATSKYSELTQSIDIYVLKFVNFGKGLIKKLRMSPDAFCQMAIQLTYFRLHKQLALTYESGATFRFYQGRTDTVRSCSMAAKAFVEAMDDTSVDDKEKLSLLRKAVKQHAKYMRAATNGDGIDRHLLGLKILAAGTQTQTDFFEDKAYKLEFKLSTSQTPATNLLGGGFAPLCQDGYGVSYVVAEDRLWFHISAYTTSAETSAVQFHDGLKKSLIDMHQMCFADAGLERSLAKRKFQIMRAD